MEKKIICGIYKITSPSGRVYIGESSDIYERWMSYKRLDCKGQIRLFNSFKKHDMHAHTFEIIEECLFDDLLCRERFWQDEFNVLSRKGMNCKLTQCGDKKGVHSEETKKKISEGVRKSRLSEDTIKRMSESQMGKKLSDYNKQKLREKWLGDKNPNYGKPLSEEHKKKLSESKKGCKFKTKMKLINIETLIIFDSIHEVADTLNIKYATFYSQLKGINKNKTSFLLLEDYNKNIKNE